MGTGTPNISTGVLPNFPAVSTTSGHIDGGILIKFISHDAQHIVNGS